MDNNSSNTKILIIEDEEAIAKVLQEYLNKNLFYSFIAYNGEDGLKELENQHYDLILLDIILPGINGWEVMRRIQAKGYQSKIIVLSNLFQEDNMQKAKDMGAIDYIVKSDGSIGKLVEKIKGYI